MTCPAIVTAIAMTTPAFRLGAVTRLE